MTGPLYDLQLARGARMERFGEWELPAHYGDPLHEYRAVREGIGVIDRTPRAFIRISGPDRFTWLQGMVSNDVRRLESGERSLPACILTSTGHLIADLTILNFGDYVLLDLDWQNRARVYETLDQFLIVEDVELAFADDLGSISLQGSRANLQASATVTSGGVLEVAADHTGEGGLDVYAPGPSLEQIRETVIDSGIQPVGEQAAETLRIEAGIPRYGVDMDERTIPLEAGLEATHISHSKGCYIGQEVIHRIHSRGHTNRALTGFILEGSDRPAHYERVFLADSDSAKEVGWITSSTHSPALQRVIALGYLRHELREPGTKLRTESGMRLSVAVLPFYGPNR